MLRTFLILFISLIPIQYVIANHIVGGEIEMIHVWHPIINILNYVDQTK